MGAENPTIYLTFHLDVYIASTIFSGHLYPCILKGGRYSVEFFKLNLGTPYYLTMDCYEEFKRNLKNPSL